MEANQMKDQMINIKDNQPLKGDKILFLNDKNLVNGMEYKEFKDGLGIAHDSHDDTEETFEYWAYTITIN